MNKKNFHILFVPLIVTGIIISLFGIFLIFLGESVEHGEGFGIVGKRFVIAGIATIGLGYFAQYYLKIRNSFMLFKYFLKNIYKKDKSYR